MNTSPERQANTDEQDEMLPEYDFSGKTGVRGKYYQAMRNGYTIKINRQDGTTLVQHISRPEGTITLDQDVQNYFPDSESVNRALRSLIQLIPTRKAKRTGRTRTKRKA
jgi:hypothetical protein